MYNELQSAMATPASAGLCSEQPQRETTVSDATHVVEGWTASDRPPNLFRRFQFNKYSETRTFLDRLADLSKDTGRYPDIGFGTTYANITVHAADGKAITAEEQDFARRVNQLYVPA